MRYELTQDLLTGNQLIDSEHRQLFDAINALLDAQCEIPAYPQHSGGHTDYTYPHRGQAGCPPR